MKDFVDPGERAWIEVDLRAVVRNLRAIRRYLGSTVRIMAVVKANAYGHGAVQVAQAIAQSDPSCAFGVATPEEALELRACLPSVRIMVLSPTLPEAAPLLVENEITPVLSSEDVVRALADAARSQGKPVNVHIEIDTGMGRSGVLPRDAPAVVEAILATGVLNLEGLMTHFPCPETDRVITAEQILVFRLLAERLASNGVHIPVMHASGSAAMLLYPEARLGMVRPGLALYGLLPALPGWSTPPELDPALSLRARVLLIRNLPRGAPISYGGTYCLRRDSRLAVVGIGYADGYPRHLSNRAEVIIRGRRSPVLGAVCMDVLMTDVTDIPEAQPGDVVTLIGVDGDQRIRAEDLARAINTTEHEITTRLGPRLPRRYIPVC